MVRKSYGMGPTNRLSMAALVLFVCAVLPVAASAAMVNFGTLAQPGTDGINLGNTVIEDGYVFTSDSVLNVWQTESPFHPGGAPENTSLMDYFAGATTVMTREDGEVFRVTAIEFAAWGPGQYGTMDITVTGKKADTSEVSQTFTVANPAGGTPSLQRFLFASEFTNLTSVTFVQGVYGSNAFQYNNIETTVVPLPAAAWLLLPAVLGLFGLGFRRS